MSDSFHERLLRAALEAGEDPHKAWSAHIFGKQPEDVTPQERTQAKAENYCLLYGGDFMKTVNWPQTMVNL